MKTPLHILQLEDDPLDALLIRKTLEAGGILFESTCVHTRDDFVAALDKGGIDIVLSDFSLPTFDGLKAVELSRKRWPDLPIILVSRTLGEDVAIETLKSGATDYILKQGLPRLIPALKRAMHEVEVQKDKRILEHQFIEAQKMEVIGQLAGGVAHDFNNILAVIMGYGELLLPKMRAGSPERMFTEEILHASQRAVGLTRQLLVFSRKQTISPAVQDLNHLVKEMESMLRRLIDENIQMTVAYGQEPGSIHADRGYIGQLLMNLVVNARDAMPHGGKLTISTGQLTLDATEAQKLFGPTRPVSLVPQTQAGAYITLSVGDTGTGMTEEVQARLFEAFFTTKPTGKGTGLGLPTCKTIVEQSGGEITFTTQLGIGTVFTIYFPRIHQSPTVSVRDGKSTSPLPRGNETLLVVEDEPTLRHLARSVLEGQGYQVLTAANGQDGLHIAQGHKQSPIQLVVTDVIMPLMGGKVMSEWLKIFDPRLKILFTSG
jgi:two-component system, cell cycle sensor histidine kinase and response regulator CckA